MRRAFLIGVSVLALSSASALADPESTINDSGTGNTNTVDQQLVTPGGGTASSSITQAGTSVGNIVNITQADAGDQSATVTQAGDTDTADIIQEDFGGGAGSFATIDQDDAGNSGNTASIIQSGTDNNSTITQRGAGNVSSSEQTGIGHISTISADGVDPSFATVIQSAANGATSSVIQSGDGNHTATVNQTLDGANSEVNQLGFSGTSTVLQ